jgi:hypothetical protein
VSNTEFPGQVDNAIVLTFEACRDPATGRLTDEIEAELKSLRSMTYVSPTGRGVCVVGTNDAPGPLPPGKTTRWIDGSRVEIDVRSEPAAIPVPPEIVGRYEIVRTVTDETRELLNFLADAPRNRTQSESKEIGFEIVRFVKSGGPLTKRIGLSPEGKVNSDGSACVMWLGSALRTPLNDLRKFATLIDNLASNEAIGLGALRSGLPDEVEIVRKAKLAAMNGKTSNVIARTADAIRYVCDKPALALIDIDTKGMPIEVADRIKDAGGYWAALLRVLPGLESAARVVRPSTSTGLYRTDTGERFEGSGGFHIYLAIANGADCERFLGTFHNRCWLHGFGWHMVGRAGQLLERSLIDRTVCAGERLVFEANPHVVEPLKQDTSARAPVVTAGATLDTVRECVPLTLVEQSKLDHLLAKSKLALAPESANARSGFVKEHAEKIAGRTGRTLADALRITGRWCEGTLTDTWLCDVAADHTGKCILIAAALTLIERSLLPDRPVFFVSAGRRGGGKTTTLIMLLMAVTGVRPSAAAWSPNEEERRKALLAYLMEALPAIIWDNIPRGTQISCPHIERSCTTAFYSDRRLGVSELVAVAAAVVHLFTGNNIGPRGDLASRALTARLEIERPDPENRPFAHPDPIGWTEAHRGRILCALYTILLGNPNLRAGRDAARKTRFKLWWHLVGSAIEHAVIVSGGSLDFQKLFLSQEEDEEESASLADALIALDENWPNGKEFSAADVARMANDQSAYTSDADRQRDVTVREFLFPSTPHGQTVTAKAVGKRLKRHLGEPVQRGDHTLILKERRDPHGGPKGAISYFVQAS